MPLLFLIFFIRLSLLFPQQFLKFLFFGKGWYRGKYCNNDILTGSISTLNKWIISKEMVSVGEEKTYSSRHGKDSKYPSTFPVYNLSTLSFNSWQFICSIWLQKQTTKLQFVVILANVILTGYAVANMQSVQFLLLRNESKQRNF